MTQQAADDGAAQTILVRKLIAAHGSEAPFGHGLFPGRNIAEILGVGALNAADGGDAHAVEVGARFGGVALKIAVERAVLLGDGELVAGLGEMVHADVEIAGLEKFEQAHAEDFEFFHAFREMRGEGALLFLQPRHVCVAEESYAVRGESENLIHGVGESDCRLVGKAVNQIDVDAIKAKIARGEEQVARHFVRLDAVHRLLHFGMEVLNAHAETVEAEFVQRFEMLARGYTGVDFDPNLTVGVEMEMFFRECEEILDLLGCQVGGSAAAPMELDYGAILRDALADALQLLLENAEVGRRDAFVFLNDDVARAKETEAFTEGNMHVQRDRRSGMLGFFMHFFQIDRAESVVPDRSGGIAGIARPWTIVLCEEFLAYVELATHVLKAWMCECHARRLLPHLRSGSGLLKQRVLASFDKELGILDRRILQDTVAKVEDVAAASQGVDGGQSHIANFVGRSQ